MNKWIFNGAVIMVMALILTFCSTRSSAHGYYVPPVVEVPPVVVPPAPPPPATVAPAPVAPASAQPAAPGPGKESVMFKIVPIALGVLAAYIAYCMATEDPDWCKREETPVWPGP